MTYAIGQRIESLRLPPLTRHNLALYCGASGDHNPLHTDIDFARGAGFNDVIGHGMLTMAFVGRFLTDLAGPDGIREWNVRFVGMSAIADAIECDGTIAAIEQHDGEECLRIQIVARANDKILLTGEALIAAR